MELKKMYIAPGADILSFRAAETLADDFTDVESVINLGFNNNWGSVVAFTAPEAVDEVVVVVAGNVNLDATVDYSDLQVLYQHLSTSNKLTGVALDAANVNGDGQIDFSDLQRLFANLSGQ